MSNQAPQSLTDLLRPKTVDDLPLSEENIQRLNQMISHRNFINVILHGATGTGKTTACEIIIDAIGDMDGNKFRGSAVWTMDTIAQIDGYASSSAALIGGRKACLIDELDLLPKRMQVALRSVIDKAAKSTTLLFTANDIKKVIPAIQSRTLLISFDTAPSDYPEAKQRLCTRYIRVLAEANIAVDPVRLNQIVEDHFPDLRTITNRIQWEFGTAVAA
jgi:replication-associated recombination protein RarA